MDVNDMLWNGSEEDGNVSSECKENEGTDYEDRDSDTDWYSIYNLTSFVHEVYKIISSSKT
jgi:hypothetical protein